MPYQNYNSFDQTYFEGTSVSSPHPAGYSNYRRDLLPFDHYSQKIHDELVANGIDPTGEKVLVVGCAYGYTVEYLIDNWDVEAYGMDVSTYAVGEADTEIAYGGRIYQGDVLNSSDLDNVRQSTQGGKFSVIVNECTLECLTDSEAQTAATNLQDEAQNAVVHRIWSTDGSDLNTDEYNAKTLSEWQSLVDSAGDDYWYTEESFQPGGN